MQEQLPSSIPLEHKFDYRRHIPVTDGQAQYAIMMLCPDKAQQYWNLYYSYRSQGQNILASWERMMRHE